MTTETLGRRASSIGDGVTTIFPVPFQFIQTSDLRVYSYDSALFDQDLATLLTEGVDYTVTGNGRTATAAVIFGVAPAVGKYITRFRLTTREQDADYVPNDGFPAETHETQLDRLSMVEEEEDYDINELMHRSARVPRGELLNQLPYAIGRANRVFGFDGGGQPELFFLSNVIDGTKGLNCTSRALLAGITGMGFGQAVILTEWDHEGIWVWTSGDFSTLCTADTHQGIAVASSTIANTIGCWLRKPVPNLNVLWFDADRTGANSSLAAFNAAIAVAQYLATGGNSLNYHGVTIYIPDGEYKIDGSLTTITDPNITFRGESRAAILNLSGTGNVFTWNGANAWGGGISQLTMRYKAAPANTACVITASGSARDLVFSNLEIYNANRWFIANVASAIWFDHVNGYVYNSGRPTFELQSGAALWLSAVSTFVDGVGVPASDRTSTMTTVADTDFVLISGDWDALYLVNGTNCNRYYHGLKVQAASKVVSNITLDDSTIIDFCRSDAILLNAVTNATGGIFHVSIGACYIVSWEGIGISLIGGNPNAAHVFDGCRIYFAGTHGVYLDGPAVRDVKIANVQVMNPNRIVGTSSGILLKNFIGYVDVVNCTVKADPAAVLPWSATFGITVIPNMNHYSVVNCTAIGTTKNYFVDPDTSFSATRSIRNNKFADYAGFRTDSIFVRPTDTGAGVDWENKSPFDVQVRSKGMDHGIGAEGADFSRSDLSGIITIDFTWLVKPGHSVFIAYSDPAKAKMYFQVLE